MFDYVVDSPKDNPDRSEINSNHSLKFSDGAYGGAYTYGNNRPFMNGWTGKLGNGYGGGVFEGIVQNELGEDGYPVLEDGLRVSSASARPTSQSESLAYLFNPTIDQADRRAYPNVSNLLTVNDRNYFEYDSNKHFASLNTRTNEFEVRAVDEGWAKEDPLYGPGYFPFNNMNGDGTGFAPNEARNYHFGTVMTTRFLQTEGGRRPGSNDAITYEFSGDDDVWIFIDGKLVADLGGIHDAVSVSINFATGEVKRSWKFKGETTGDSTTLGKLMGLNEATLPDNTLHTLKFFYLERGQGASNMKLQFNLVTVPESNIIKTDAEGNELAGAQFALYHANENYEKVGDAIATGRTNNQGEITLVDSEDKQIYFTDIYNRGLQQGQELVYYVLEETSAPNGYRKAADMQLFYDKYSGALLSQNRWETGTFAEGLLSATLAVDPTTGVSDPYKFATGLTVGGKKHDTASDFIQDNGEVRGSFFAVVQHRDSTATGSLDNGEAWYSVYPDANNPGAWKLSANNGSGWAGVAEAAQNKGAFKATVNTNGQYQVDIELPGNVEDYYHYILKHYGSVNGHEDDVRWTVSFYYTTAEDVTKANESNTARLANSDHFTRQFGASLNVTDMPNELYIQKYDEQRNPVNGVTFGLYEEDDLVREGGKASIKEGAQPLGKVTTGKLQIGTIEKEGAALYPGNDDDNAPLIAGETYYLAEISVPDGYEKNESIVEVRVTDNETVNGKVVGGEVFANATAVGTNAGDKDGVRVIRGVGHLSPALAQFAYGVSVEGAGDAVYADTTLHDIAAQFVTSDNIESGKWTPGKELHLSYGAAGRLMDYGPTEKNGDIHVMTEDGWSKFQIQQCLEHKDDQGQVKQQYTDLRDELGNDYDLAPVFEGYTVVEFTNQTINDLEIAKEVNSDNPDQSLTDLRDASYNFTLSLTVPGPDGNDIALPDGHELRVVRDVEAGTGVGVDPKPIKNGKVEFTLKHGQKAVIEGLPVQAKYTVTETNPGKAFTVIAEGNGDCKFDKGNLAAFGTLADTNADTEVPDGVRVEYTNTYNLDPVGISLPLKKVLKNADNAKPHEGGTFNFAVDAAIENPDAPLPQDINNEDDGTEVPGVVSIELSKGEDEKQLDEAIVFADDAFTTAGTYIYNVYEVQDDDNPIPGVSYSQALYKVTVTVDVNPDDAGALAAAAKVERTHDDASVQEQAPVELDVATFTNTYNADAADYYISASKVLTSNGLPGKLGGKFSFKLKGLDSAPMPEGADAENSLIVNEDVSGSILFGPIEFDNNSAGADGTEYTYELSEVTDELTPDKGWTPDTRKYTIVLKVTNDNNILNVTPTYQVDGEPSDRPVFRNVYQDTPAAVQLKAVKEFRGRDMEQGESFDFTATLKSGAKDAIKLGPDALPEQGLKASVSGVAANKTQEVTFGELTFSREGTYVFKIREAKNDVAGVTYDEHVVEATVVIEKDAQNGAALTANVTYNNSSAAADRNAHNDDAATKTDSAYFINQYSASGSYPLSVTKVLKGRDFMPGDVFTFKVETSQGAPMPNGSQVNPDGTRTYTVRTQNDTPRPVTFGDIAFTQDHLGATYSYTLTEVAPEGDKKGVEYDQSKYDLTLTPKADGGNIAVDATLTKDDQPAELTDGIVFTNVYTPASQAGAGVVPGSKSITGRPWKDGESFQFVISADDSILVKGYNTADTADDKTTADLVTDGLIVMPANVTAEATGAAGSNDPVSFAFDDIVFKVASDPGHRFLFNVDEVLPPDPNNSGATLSEKDGLRYDDETKTVEFSVRDYSNNGTLTVMLRTPQAASFTNEYSAAPTSVQLEAVKKLVGRDMTAGEFEFELKDADGKVLQKKTNAVDGHVKFDAISLTKEGEYTYTINEKIPDADKKNPSITYDEAVHTLTVKVTDNGTGALEHKFVVGDKEQDDQPEVKFTNTYKALPVSDTLTATKSVNDSDAGNAFVMKDGDFSFTLSKDGKEIETVSNKADGSITFKPLEFGAPGQYIYTLTENDVDDTKAPGVSKDATKYTITYEVSDKDENGNNLDTLRIASKTVKKSDGTALSADDPITFTNTYATGETTYAINGTKTIVATDPLATKREPTNDEFEFVLEPVAGTLTDGAPVDKANVPMPAGLEQDGTKVVKNGGSAFSFGDMTYTQTGTYEYLVTEKSGADPTIGYSQQQFKVVVTVVAAGEADTGEALLNATAAIALNNEPATSIAFENTYTPAPVTTATPGGTKTLQGRDMKEGEFSFVLKNSAGEVVETVANAADGTFAFSALTFDKVGTYTYTVHEEHRGETLNGVTHDSAIYSITVTVKDDPATHALVAEVAAGLEGKPVKSLDFTNTYEAAPTDVVLNASKVLTGRDLKDGEFAFEVLDADGKKVSEATNTASGQVTFKSIRLDKPGTYTYKLGEVAGSEKGMKYDGTEFTATVTVTDDGSGVLKAEIAYSADPVFKNVFTPEGGNGGNGGNPPSGGTGTTPPGGGSGTGDGDGKGDEILPTTGDQSLAPMALAVMAAAGIALTAGGLALAKRRR